MFPLVLFDLHKTIVEDMHFNEFGGIKLYIVAAKFFLLHRCSIYCGDMWNGTETAYHLGIWQEQHAKQLYHQDPVDLDMCKLCRSS